MERVARHLSSGVPRPRWTPLYKVWLYLQYLIYYLKPSIESMSSFRTCLPYQLKASFKFEIVSALETNILFGIVWVYTFFLFFCKYISHLLSCIQTYAQIHIHTHTSTLKLLFVIILCFIRFWDYVTSCVIYDFYTHKNDADFLLYE